jgi:hypothetical protein
MVADAVTELEVLVEHCAEGKGDGLSLVNSGQIEAYGR